MKEIPSDLHGSSRIIPARIYPVRYFYLTGCYKYTSGAQFWVYSAQGWSYGMPSSFGSCTKAVLKLLNLPRWFGMIGAEQWRKELASGLSDSEVVRLRLNTHTGRPLGSDSFLSKLEKLIGRRVRPLPVGRPKRKKKVKKK